jgi:hypothetical protein
MRSPSYPFLPGALADGSRAIPSLEITGGLLAQTDAVAEVHNAIRSGVKVSLVPW